MNDLLIIYVLVYLSVLIHEVSHYCVAKILKLEINTVKIGVDWPSIKIKKWRISPFLGTSYVSITSNSIISQSTKNIIFYFFSGLLSNICLATVFGIVYATTKSYNLLILLLFNCISAVVCLLPIGRTDTASLIKVLKNK